MKRSPLQGSYLRMEQQYKFRILNRLMELSDHTQTADGIAASLLEGQWFGYRRNSTADPLHEYLQRNFPDLRFVVHQDAITAQDENYTRLEIELPEPFSEFVRMFDEGVYPDLAYEDQAAQPRHQVHL